MWLEKNMKNNIKSVLSFSGKEARAFFLRSESYCNLELPEYIDIGKMVRDLFHNTLSGRVSLDSIKEPEKNPETLSDINYTLFTNKDGHYEWRKFQFIHPVFYLSLVDLITKEKNWEFIKHRFSLYQRNPLINAIGIPVSDSQNKDKGGQIKTWWENIEQESIKLSLEYAYVLQTDITNCYPSIYTHSFAWALHGKEFVKNFIKTSSKYQLGNDIDKLLRAMQYAQTNGIPQGSVLMDFLAELLLGYIDNRLSTILQREGITEYYILRYRDDYKIFTNTPLLGDRILVLLNELLAEFGFKLNAKKTTCSDCIIHSSIKQDKLAWLAYNKDFKSYQGELLNLYVFSKQYPNSGRLIVALEQIYDDLNAERPKKYMHDPVVVLAILVDLMIHNPRIYPICSAVISKVIFQYIPVSDKDRILSKIYNRFKNVVNNAYLELWFQRIAIPLGVDLHYKYNHTICQLIQGTSGTLWNNSWVKEKYLSSLSKNSWLLPDKKNNVSPVINPAEFKVFFNYDFK